MKKFKIIGSFHEIIRGMLLSYFVSGKVGIDIEVEYRLVSWKPYALLTLNGTDTAMTEAHHIIEQMLEKKRIMSYPV